MKVKHLVAIVAAVLILAATVFVFIINSRESLWDETLLVENRDKKILYGPAKDPFNKPVGVAVDQEGNLYVADSDNHRILVFDRELQLVKKFGKYGQGPVEFGYPIGIGVNTVGEVFVSEINNNRVQVVSQKGEFLRFFPKNSSEIKGPSAIFVDSLDQVYIFDRGGQQLKIFDREGNLTGEIGGQEGPGQVLRFVMGIGNWGHEGIVVSDSGNRSIKIFNQKGLLREQLIRNNNGIPNLGLPRGIAVIGNDKFAVVDAFNRKVFLIWKKGDSWQSKALGHQFTLPDGVCYSKGRLFVTDRGENSIIIFEEIR